MTGRAVVPYVRRADWPTFDRLVDELRAAMPEFEIVLHAELTDEQRAAARVAIADGPSADQLATLSNLELIQSTWAGVEQIIPIVPGGVRIARMIDPQLAFTMSEAVLASTLYLHRDMPRYLRQQRNAEWNVQPLVRTSARRIGVLGLGALGSHAAATLRDHGFVVAGWSRSEKAIAGIDCVHGDAGLGGLLARSDIVVNLLPHTPATAGLLGAAAFGAMPAGSSLVNFGRGETVEDDALLDALDRGHLDHAVLDVFDTEPLPADHPYWRHPRVTVLPHISGPTSPDTAAAIAAQNVRRFLADGRLPVDALVDPDLGY